MGTFNILLSTTNRVFSEKFSLNAVISVSKLKNSYFIYIVAIFLSLNFLRIVLTDLVIIRIPNRYLSRKHNTRLLKSFASS